MPTNVLLRIFWQVLSGAARQRPVKDILAGPVCQRPPTSGWTDDARQRPAKDILAGPEAEPPANVRLRIFWRVLHYEQTVCIYISMATNVRLEVDARQRPVKDILVGPETEPPANVRLRIFWRVV